MKATSPKAKGGGATNAARINPHSTEILFNRGLSVNHVLAQWRKEAARLWNEFQRTGNVAYWKEFRVHRAAMGGRMHGKAANQ